mmetsp:Transcript_23921/g.74813  ORF Transcript_23921/g.74813 Transcript_23921/m.74813 type:complete len:223 (+) Transcript_23921:114-782(+)
MRLRCATGGGTPPTARLPRRLGRSAEVGRKHEYVAENPLCGHLRPRPRPADDQRLVRVPPRGEGDDVVRSLEGREWVGLGECLERHGGLVGCHVDSAHEAQHLAVRLRLRHLLAHLPVEVGEPAHVLLHAGSVPKRLRNKALYGHIFELEHEARLPCQRHHLAGHVCAREVVPRVGLREPQLLGLLDDVREVVPRLEGVEDVRERAREDPLDLDDLVARRLD